MIELLAYEDLLERFKSYELESWKRPIVDYNIDFKHSEFEVIHQMRNNIIKRINKLNGKVCKLPLSFIGEALKCDNFSVIRYQKLFSIEIFNLRQSIIELEYLVICRTRAKLRLGHKNVNEYMSRWYEYKLKLAFEIFKNNPENFLLELGFIYNLGTRFRFNKIDFAEMEKRLEYKRINPTLF